MRVVVLAQPAKLGLLFDAPRSLDRPASLIRQCAALDSVRRHHYHQDVRFDFSQSPN